MNQVSGLMFWLLTLLIAGSSAAQTAYPSKSIRLIVPSAPGGQPDIVSRLIANELGKQMGKTVVVDNRAGASGIVGFEAIAKTEPDGYTLGFAIATIMINPSIFAKLPYDAERDFQPVTQSHESANLLTITPSLPIRTVKELIEHARSNPGKLTYGSAGNGTSMHIGMELFKQMTGTEIVHVSYKGIQQAITDAIGGQVHIVVDNMGSILPHVRSGKLRTLGITTSKRSPALPDVPTIAEAGLTGFEIVPSAGFILPARTPREIVMRLNAEINKALQVPAVTEKYSAMGLTIVGGTPERFAAHLRSETAKWGKVIKAASIKPD